MKIKDSPKNMPGLRLVGEDESGSVFTTFGPVRAGLTTSQIIRDPALSELLSDLERKVDDLISKSYTVLDTLTIDLVVLRAVLSLGTENEAGTDESC